VRAGDQVAGRYRLEVLLGAGGFGEVWRSQDENLDRAVALKLIHESMADETARSRFLEEARITANLAHPNVVAVLDFGFLEDDRPYLVYELVEGGSLESPGPVTSQRLRAWGTQLAEALGAAHDGGVLHRDLKPENVLLRAAGEAVLCDFGVARSAAKATRLTAEGLLLGTPAYMAPELWRGKPASRASDQFAWAATLVRLAGGGSVYGSDEVTAIVEASRDSAPLDLPDLPHLPAAAREVLARALALDPAARFPTIRAAGRAWNDALANASSGPMFRPGRDEGGGVDQHVATVVLRSSSRRDPSAPITRRTRLRRRHHLALVAVATLGLGVGALLVGPRGDRDGAPPAPSPSTSPPVAPDSLDPARTQVEDLLARLQRGLDRDPMSMSDPTPLADLPEETRAWVSSPDFDAAFLASADSLARHLNDVRDLSADDLHWILRRAAEELRDVLGLLANLAAEEDIQLEGRPGPLRARFVALRKALEGRYDRSAGEPEGIVRGRHVVLWSTLLIRADGKPSPLPIRATINNLSNEPSPFVRLWMRYRLTDAVQWGRGMRCPRQLHLLRVLARDAPALPIAPDSPPGMVGLADAVRRKLIQGMGRGLRRCPSAVRPEHWRFIDASLEMIERDLVVDNERNTVLRAQFERITKPDSVFDALGQDPPLVARFHRRINLLKRQAKALSLVDLPDWVRQLPAELDELSHFLGPDARLPFSEDHAAGGGPNFDVLEATRRLDTWLDLCRRAFLSSREELPSEAWPWLVRHLLPAPSRLLRATDARVARLRNDETILPEQEEAWARILARLHQEAQATIGRMAFGDSRPPILAQWLLAQAGELIRGGDYVMSGGATPLEYEDSLRSWMLLVMLDNSRETKGNRCGEIINSLHEVLTVRTWRQGPPNRTEGLRRILIDITAFAARCDNELQPAMWKHLDEAIQHMENLIPRDPDWVAHATERALEAPRLALLGGVASPRLRKTLEEIDRVRRLALSYRFTPAPGSPPSTPRQHGPGPRPR
jgi:serine/threonine protein kinase